MIWDYNYRDLFGQRGGVHTDILIVPHATNVNIVPGEPPEVTSKVPAFNDDGEYNADGSVIKPATIQRDKNGNVIYSDPQFIITNENIIKEKFEYVSSIDTGDNLGFTSCESSMVKFTIRNDKYYEPNPNQEDDPLNNKYYGVWKTTIPNLQKVEIYSSELTGDNKEKTVLIGECEGRYVIKVYIYYNGDSSTLFYLGMFVVEEDKVSTNGYEREITAYDYMLTLRDMDCIEWYKRLFKGHKGERDKNEKIIDGDYDLDALAHDQTEKNDGSGWITVGEALSNFISELNYRTGARTVTDPQNYRKDISAEDYPGPGVPIVLDPFILDSNEKYEIPGARIINSNIEQEIECYGYLNILELKFYFDEKLEKQDSLSFGKFLEDIGALSGRYPFIRRDFIIDDDYDFVNKKATTYEKCVLSFKPLPKDTIDIKEENMLDNTEIAKGFQHDYYNVEEVKIVSVWSYNDKEDPMVSYRDLTKTEEKQRKKLVKDKSDLKTLHIQNNTFTAYLDKTKDTHKGVLTQLFGTATSKNPHYESGLFKNAYNNIRHRTYTPFEMTTYADLCREPGDRISISYYDIITGEYFACESYILEMKLSGIQNMLITYTARGDQTNSTFSDYKTGTKYSAQSSSYQTWIGGGGGESGGGDSGGGGTTQSITGLSVEDFVEIIRNLGFRLLDEPSGVSYEYNPASTTVSKEWKWITTSYDHYAQYILVTELTEGATTNPITLIDYDDNYDEVQVSRTVEPLNYLYGVDYDLGVSYIWIFTEDSKWHYYTLADDPIADYRDGDVIPEIQTGDTTNPLIITRGGSSVSLNVDFGDWIFNELNLSAYGYQYPGVWLGETDTNFTGDYEISTTVPGGVKIKWTDPDDITNNKPIKAIWDGTVVVRKENKPPLHRWDGTLVVDETTKNTYKDDPLVDSDVQANHTYYYGIFPYDTEDHYRFTKVIRVDTDVVELNPEIESIKLGSSGTWDGSETDVLYVGSHNKMTAKVANSHIVFTLYSDSNVVYSFNAASGTTAADISNIYVSFIKEEEMEIAKPSFLYKSGNTYSYNQETLSDSDMEKIFKWLNGEIIKLPWHIIDKLIVDGNVVTWDIPQDLRSAIETQINTNRNVMYADLFTDRILSSYGQFAPVPFLNSWGSQGTWQGVGDYSIGLGTLTVTDINNQGTTYYYFSTHASASDRVGISRAMNTNGTSCLLFIKNDALQQAAMVNVYSAWRLSYNEIQYSYDLSDLTSYEKKLYTDIISAIPAD